MVHGKVRFRGRGRSRGMGYCLPLSLSSPLRVLPVYLLLDGTEVRVDSWAVDDRLGAVTEPESGECLDNVVRAWGTCDDDAGLGVPAERLGEDAREFAVAEGDVCRLIEREGSGEGGQGAGGAGVCFVERER